MSATGAYQFSIMAGAIFFYLLSGLKNEFSFYNSGRFKRKNLWVGYTLQLIIGLGLFYLILKNSI